MKGVRESLPLAVLLLAGALHWVLFLSPAEAPLRGPAFTVEDWPKEYRYYSVLQQAVREGRVPLYTSRPIHTRKFMALPETLWSPQVVLLGVLDVGPFVVVNTLLLYAAGCVGLLALRRRYRLSLPVFAALLFAFFLNGHITAHIAVGHSMWTGFFLLPFFVLLVLQAVEGEATRRTAPLLGLVLFAIVLQGALHLFVWCSLLLGLAALFRFALARTFLPALGWAIALSLCRLVPAFFLLNRKTQDFLSGVPSPAALWHGLVTLRGADHPVQGGSFGTLSWWELDFYVGPAGLALIAGGGLWLRFRAEDRARWRRPGLDAALFALALLAAGDLYSLVNASGLPLLSAERVSSRFLALPLVVLVVLGAARLEEALRAHPAARVYAWAGVAVLGFTLARHSVEWRVPHLEATRPARAGNLEMTLAGLDTVADSGMERAYRAVVPLSAVASLIALAAAGLVLRRERPRAAAARSADATPRGQSPPGPPSTEG